MRRQAIIWTSDGKFNDAYMRHSASMSKNIQVRLWTLYNSVQRYIASTYMLLSA